MEITWNFVFDAPVTFYDRIYIPIFYPDDDRFHQFIVETLSRFHQKREREAGKRMLKPSPPQSVKGSPPMKKVSFPKDEIESLLAFSIEHDLPVYRTWGHWSYNRFFASRLPVVWSYAEGFWYKEVSPGLSFWNYAEGVAIAEPLPYKYENNTLTVVRWVGDFREAIPFEWKRGDLVEVYEGFAIKYLPSNRFGMRFGCYPQNSNRAFAIVRSLREAKLACERKVGILPQEKGAAVLGGNSPGPKPYDAVLGGTAPGGTTPASTPSPTPTSMPVAPKKNVSSSYTDDDNIWDELWAPGDFEIE